LMMTYRDHHRHRSVAVTSVEISGTSSCAQHYAERKSEMLFIIIMMIMPCMLSSLVCRMSPSGGCTTNVRAPCCTRLGVRW
jgi:hypothetical protein